MSDPSPIFCCPSDLLTTVTTYRSPKECALWYFARCMADLISTPISSPLAPLTPTSLSSSPSPSPIPAGFLAAVLNESPFVVQFERWVEGEREEMRWFILHPGRENAFLELERGALKGKSGRGRRWEWGWAHIKLRCEHLRTLFVVKMLERVGREERALFGRGKRKRDIEVQDEDGDKDKDEDEQSVLVSEDEEVEEMLEGQKASFRGSDDGSGDVEVDGHEDDRSDI